jgi:hypothetical protein
MSCGEPARRGRRERTFRQRAGRGRLALDPMMKVPAASAATKKSYDAIVASLVARGAESGAMFGMPTIKFGGKGFAGLFGDAVVFKLGGTAHAAALALSGAALFDPSGMGRAMKEWVVVPSKHSKRWSTFAHDALEYVQGASAAPKKKAAAARAPAKKKAAPKAKAKTKAR